MTRKPSKSGFTKLLAADITLLSADPLIGLLELETDSGTIELAMNRIMAERLVSTLVATEAGHLFRFTGFGAGRRRSICLLPLRHHERGLAGCRRLAFTLQNLKTGFPRGAGLGGVDLQRPFVEQPVGCLAGAADVLNLAGARARNWPVSSKAGPASSPIINDKGAGFECHSPNEFS
jgi:hypothetical protein